MGKRRVVRGKGMSVAGENIKYGRTTVMMVRQRIDGMLERSVTHLSPPPTHHLP